MIAAEPDAGQDGAGSLESRILDFWGSRTDCFPFQWWSKERGIGGYAKACAHKPPWVVGKCPQKVDGRTCSGCPDFSPIPLDQKIIRMHLRGMITAGAYQIGEDGSSVRWACLDFDDHGEVPAEELEEGVRAARLSLEDLYVPTVAEASGGQGWRCHLWAFFSGPVPAIKARVILDAALRQAGLSDKPYIERFPKQSRALNGYGNLVKIPFGVNKKTGRRSQILGQDLKPVYGAEQGLALVEPVDPAVVSYVIDMRKLPVTEPTVGLAKPVKDFDLPVAVMNRILTKCWYFRELERQQMARDAKVHYEDWWNYLLMFARFGDAGVERILRLSALDDRFDAYYTMQQIAYVRSHGYHAPSCAKRLKAGPGLIHCPYDPLECGAA